MKSEVNSSSASERGDILSAIIGIAERSPRAVALTAPGRAPLTYEGLAGRLAGLTADLRRRGVREGRRLAVILPTGPDAVVSSLAVMSCATSMPLNPGWRAAELEDSLLRLRADGVLAGADAGDAAFEAARSRSLPVIRLSSSPCDVAGEFRLDGEALLESGSHLVRLPAPAVVMSTSGTTGRPKNVPLTHSNLAASVDNVRAWMSLTGEDRLLCPAPSYHIAGVALALAALRSGSGLFCAPYYGAAFPDWVEEFQPTCIWLTPTMLRELLPLARRRRATFGGGALRFIRCGSSTLPLALMSEAEELFGVPVLENYGMTEAAPQIACNPLPPGRRRPGSAGLPAGPEVKVAGGTGATAAAGVTGEILVRGPNVFAGYEDDDEANRTAFQDGWFRTGDLGHFDADGFLYVTGRVKELINRGGEKIAPREVEDALLEHPAVAEAAVFAIPHPRLGEDIGAAVVLRGGATASTQELRETAARRLAAYKAPARVWILPEIPKGPGGKLQRAGLAERLGLEAGPATPVAREPRVTPATPLEEQLAAIWKSILNAGDIGIHDDFYDLGGDSFALNLLLAEVQERFHAGNRLLDRIAFLDAPTIATQARLIAEGTAAPAAGPALPAILKGIQPAGSKPPLFFVRSAGESSSEALHLAHALDSGWPVYAFRDPVPAHQRGLYSIEDVAANLVAAIRTVQPRGPYHLTGHCFGGVVVFDAARRLIEAGEKVGLLVLIDTPTPNYPRLIAHAGLYWQALARWSPSRILGRDAGGLRGLASDGAALARHIKRQAIAPLWRRLHGARTARELLALDDVYDANVRAQRAYLPKPYPGSLVHFLARRHPRSGSPLDRRFGWREFVGGIAGVVVGRRGSRVDSGPSQRR